jgi:phage tail protein X
LSFRPVKPRAYGTERAVISALLDASGGAAEVAEFLDLGLSQVYAYTDDRAPDPGKTVARISFYNVVKLAERCRCLAPLEYLAAKVGAFVTPVEHCEDSLARLLARGAEAHGAAMSRFCDGVARHPGGRLTDADRAPLMRDLDAEIRALVCARRALESNHE